MINFRKTLIIFLVLLMIIGCGGGGGNSVEVDDNNDIVDDGGTETGENEDKTNLANATVQNKNVNKYIDNVSILAVALKEGYDLIQEYLGEYWDIWDWTADDLSLYLTDEEINTLVNELQTIIKQDIVPSAESLSTAANEIINAEKKFNYSSNSFDNSLIQPYLTGVEVLVVLTVFGLVAGAGKGAADAVNETSHMPTSTPQEYAVKLEATLKKWPEAAYEAMKAVVVTGAEEFAGWATGTQGYQKTTIVIKATSAVHSGITVKNAFGIKRCDQPQPHSIQSEMQPQAIDTSNLYPDEIYIGRSDESGVFHHIPDGYWTFVAFEDGFIRGITACYELLEEEDISEIQVEMEPIDDPDVDLPVDDSCTDTSGIFVWYVDNLPLKDIFVSSCESYVSEDALCSYQGGGLDCSIIAKKVLLGSGYKTTDEAVNSTCSTVNNIRQCGSTWSCGWLGDIGGQRHVIDNLGGCQ